MNNRNSVLRKLYSTTSNERSDEPGRRFDAIQLSDDIKEVNNKNKVLRSLYSTKPNEQNKEVGRRFDCIQLSDDIKEVDNDNPVLRELYSKPAMNNYNDGYSSAGFQEKNSFGRRVEGRRFDDTRRRGGSAMNNGNKQRMEPKKEELSQRILRAMEYDPYFDQQQERELPSDTMDRESKREYTGRAVCVLLCTLCD